MKKTIYHSTTETCLKQILKSQTVKTCRTDFSKTKQPGTLGFGFYGFSDSELCKKYGKEKKENFKFLACDISVQDDRVLDLRDEEELRLYDLYKEEIIKDPDFIEEAKYWKNNRQSSKEGAMLDYYLDFLFYIKLITIDCVIGMTATQFETSERSYLANGVEYCVKNKSIIKTIKEVEL